MANFLELLKKGFADNHLAASDKHLQQLQAYLELMLVWNRAFNLTAITEPKDMVYLHILDSLAIAPFLRGTRLLDVGSGAGLPGIPLAILYPEQHWVLLDKNSKKTRFLTQVISELGLDNIEVVHSRSEDFQPSKCFDSIVARALSTLESFINTTQHLICPQGVFIAMKGKYPEMELNAMPRHYKVLNATRLEVNGLTAERHVIVIGKKLI